MRIILDEGVPRRLAILLNDQGLDAESFPDVWRGFSDHMVIESAIEGGFSVLVTQDKNMPFQRPLAHLKIAVLIVPEMDRKAVLTKTMEIAARIPSLEVGRYALLGLEGSLRDPPTKPLKA